jgi:hypothetical protein
MIYLTGIQPDRDETRERFQAERVHTYSAAILSEFEQPDSRIRNQKRNGSCLGQAFAGGSEAWLDWLVSAIAIWVDGRRRQGDLLDITKGIALEFGVASMLARGLSEYHVGEDDDAPDFDKDGVDDRVQIASLEDELAAADHRSLGLTHTVPAAGDLDSLEAALTQPNVACVMGTGVRDPYFSYVGAPNATDAVLGIVHLGGYVNGHGQRVRAFARKFGRRIYMLQNSWGVTWGGCHSLDGTFRPGCAWVDEDVMRFAWDIHLIEINR